MADNVDVSIIVPAYNAEKTLALCMESLLAQSTVEPFEIIVVDDGSIDCTREVAARYPEVRVLHLDRAGASAARNLGAREARGSILCYIDADCEATPGWLESFLEAFRAGADGAKGTLLSRQRALVARFTQIEYEDRYDRMSPERPINFIDTASAAYRRAVFLDTGEGGFDAHLFPGASVEDQELSFRLAKRGCDLRFVPGATVYHRHPDTLKAYVRRKFNIGRWKPLVLFRHPERAVSDSHTPPSLKAQVPLFYGALLSLLASLASPRLYRLRRLCLLLLGLFTGSALPFIVKAARKDPAIAALSLPLLLVRAASLGAGMVYGLITFTPRRHFMLTPSVTSMVDSYDRQAPLDRAVDSVSSQPDAHPVSIEWAR